MHNLITTLRTQFFDAKLIKFVLVGVVNTLVGMAIMFGLYNLAGCSYWVSSAANYILTSILSYILNKTFTFGNKDNVGSTAVRFALNIAVCSPMASPSRRSVGCCPAHRFPCATTARCSPAWYCSPASTISASAFLPSARRRRSKERWWREPADSRAFPPAARVM